ncbi:MAG TPA: hypothetical protein VFA43_25825 [Gemmatimonadaceae bacterium]|nr:hypothetical protein [Gemmatimonadaceae bacterium]
MTKTIAIVSALWVSVASAQVKTIDNPGGGRIYLGALAGQPTPQEAFGKTLHQVSLLCGDRPRLGQLVQNKTGELLAGFFTVTGKNQDGKPMAGMALVYAPKTGSAGGAVLMDNADRFPSTVNSMFARLKQELMAGPAAKPTTRAIPTKSAAPAQPLQRFVFTDGTGVINLPAGWQTQNARMGDVTATGPNGEHLRFGWTIPVMGNAIPYGTDAATTYKNAVAMMARKSGKPVPQIDVTSVQEIPMQGGKNNFVYGHLNQQYFVAQMISTTPQVMNAWQITLFQITGPDQAMADERATIALIFPNYSRNSRQVNAIANAQIQQGIEETNQFVGTVGRYIDASDRMAAGMSDMLREQTVIMDTALAGALIDANPNRFQAVPTSGYIRGIDY